MIYSQKKKKKKAKSKTTCLPLHSNPQIRKSVFTFLWQTDMSQILVYITELSLQRYDLSVEASRKSKAATDPPNMFLLLHFLSPIICLATARWKSFG